VLQPDNIYMFAANYFAEKLHANKAQREATLSTIAQNASTGIPNVSKTKDFSSLADALYGELSFPFILFCKFSCQTAAIKAASS
jgi:hypothetical protein